jgi:hypothetical protein
MKREIEQVKRKKEPKSADGWVDVTDAGKYLNNEHYQLALQVITSHRQQRQYGSRPKCDSLPWS